MSVKGADINPAFTCILIIPEVLDKGIVANPVFFASPGFHYITREDFGQDRESGITEVGFDDDFETLKGKS